MASALANRIVATASVGAFIGFCDVSSPDRPVLHLAFHGTDDPFEVFDGESDDSITGEVVDLVEGVPHSGWLVMSWPGWSAPVIDQAATVAQRNGCSPEISSESLTDGIERVRWSCPPVVRPSWWSSKAAATAMIWRFFEQHQMVE